MPDFMPILQESTINACGFAFIVLASFDGDFNEGLSIPSSDQWIYINL